MTQAVFAFFLQLKQTCARKYLQKLSLITQQYKPN
jgi:hypothetical protein